MYLFLNSEESTGQESFKKLFSFLSPDKEKEKREKGSFFILIGCMVFLPSILDVIRLSMSTMFLLIQLDSEIFYLQNAFL